MAISEQARKNHDELFPGQVSTLAVTDPELIETFDNFAFDEVLRHGNLDARTRLVVQLASMIACQALREYRVMLGAAFTGLPYTIMRPGWFDYNGPDEHRLVLLQGDTRKAGDSSDGVIARRQIAEVLVHSLGSDHALRKTFELIATAGPAPDDFDALFAPLAADPQGALDGVHDMANMPLEDEPRPVRDDYNNYRKEKSQ
jgi:hypothetical protein